MQSRSRFGDVFAGNERLAPLLLELKALAVDLHHRLAGGGSGSARKKYGVDIEFRIQEDGGALKVFLKQARLLGAALPE